MPRPVVEDFRKDCLDICEMRRNGLLDGKPCKIQGGIRWPKIASMIIDSTCLQITLNNGQQQAIHISWAKCFRGSYRPWWVCGCGNRFAKLYRGYAGYVCRRCLGVMYACQAVSTKKRRMRRLNKIAAQVDGRPWNHIQAQQIAFPERRPGMHRRRYWRLYSKASEVRGKFAMQAGA